jgi:hypothetical protein
VLNAENYWSDKGGLVEVVASLPSKAEADTLIQRFFDAVDPLYPIVPRDAFMADFESFWLLPDEAKHKYDPAQIALQFAVYANAVHDTSLQDGMEAQINTANFYLSCCHQSLCISNYFNRCSLLTLQTLILVCHFLIASNRVADAWSISGIVQRQIYGLKLNRSPEGIENNVDGAVNDDMLQVRLRLWQAAMSQDTLLSLHLSKPSSTTHFDVNPDHIRPLSSAPPGSCSSDAAYVRAMWHCSTLIQETICHPRSIKQPLAVDATHKSHMVARFRQVYAQFEEPFCQNTSTRFDNQPPRLLFQMATLSSSYFHALVLLLIEKNDKAGLHCDPRAAVQAAHEGMAAFFALVRLSPGHMRVWTAVHNRTYAMAVSCPLLSLCYSRSDPAPCPTPLKLGLTYISQAVIGAMLILHGKDNGDRGVADDARLMVGRSDFDRYLNLLGRAQGLADFRVIQRERLANLKALQADMMDTCR